MDIYVVVRVTYDWYRFQENLFASVSIEDCKNFIKKLEMELDTYEYSKFDKKYKQLSQSEEQHYWIEKLTMDQKG